METFTQVSERKTILVCPWSGVGHVNGVLGAISSLIKRGNRVVIIVEKSYEGRLTPFGVEEFIYEETDVLDEKAVKPAQKWATLFETFKFYDLNSTPLERLKNFANWITSDETVENLKFLDKIFDEAIKKLNPDLLVLEEMFLLPSLYKSNKPWIKCLTANPYYFIRDHLSPPFGTGLPLNSDRSEWKQYEKILEESLDIYSIKEMKKLDSSYPEDPEKITKNLKLISFAWPLELIYPHINLNEKYFNLEVNSLSNLKKTENFDLEKLTGRKFLENDLHGEFSGKLVYLSLGTMASMNIDFMKKLISALSQTKHKFIVSKGLRHEKFELASNMWGDAYVPQLNILPIVDLVITHGGHNTVTETFFFGKPMIIIPFFGDQPDNAQRLHETRLGIRLNACNFTDDEIIKAIDELLYNKEINNLLRIASDRLQNSNAHDRFADLVEKIFV